MGGATRTSEHPQSYMKPAVLQETGSPVEGATVGIPGRRGVMWYMMSLMLSSAVCVSVSVSTLTNQSVNNVLIDQSGID